MNWDSKQEDYRNFERWTVSRWWNTRNRYMLTATHEFGYQLKEYADRGRWQGGTAQHNRVFDSIQTTFALAHIPGIAVKRNTLVPGVVLFEVYEYSTPVVAYLIVEDKILAAENTPIKDGYRYKFTHNAKLLGLIGV